MKNKGFTIVELAVVLVIIGFLIAAVISGKSMIRSAELRELVGDYDRYTKAIKEFQDKYQAYPGDMSNAETIWDSDANCPTTLFNSTPKTETCNGNGDGRIGSSTTAGVLSTVYAYEWFRAWQQLSNAGLVDGKFTGTAESATETDAAVGLNVPQAKTGGKIGWTLHYYLLTADDTYMWADNYGHLLALGGDTSGITNAAFLPSSDALSIDQKIDDGMPGTGFIRAPRTGTQADCTENDTTQTAATYSTSSTVSSACSLLFILGL